MAIDTQTVDQFRLAVARLIQIFNEAMPEINGLATGKLLENADGTFSLIISPAQVQSIKERFVEIGTKAKAIGQRMIDIGSAP